VFHGPDGGALSEDQLRRWAISLYRDQPAKPMTSMDSEFRPQMMGSEEEHKRQPAEQGTQESSGAKILPFIGVWNILDKAAKQSGIAAAMQGRPSLAEAALLTAIVQTAALPQPVICLAGFGTGHASIVWMESSPTVRLIVFDPFTARHQLGSKAFTSSLYRERFVPLPGKPAEVLEELQHLGLPTLRCDIVHIELEAGEAALRALGGLSSNSNVLVVTGPTCGSAKGGAKQCPASTHSGKAWAEILALPELRDADCQDLAGQEMAGRRICFGHFANVTRNLASSV